VVTPSGIDLGKLSPEKGERFAALPQKAEIRAFSSTSRCRGAGRRTSRKWRIEQRAADDWRLRVPKNLGRGGVPPLFELAEKGARLAG
jgi:hypothetical protein